MCQMCIRDSLNIPPIDYQDIIYYAAPKKKEGPKSLDEVDPELMKTFDKLGIPLHERAQLSGMAVDAVMDSVSVKTTFKETLAEKGIIFCSFSEAVQHHPDLVQKYLGSVVSYREDVYKRQVGRREISFFRQLFSGCSNKTR